MISIGTRLRSERERLGMNQTEFSAVAKVVRRTQSSYETDERSPDAAYLAAIAEAGADVLYILTGRPAPVPEDAIAAALSDRARAFEGPPSSRMAGEAAILLLLRKLPDADLAVVRRMLEGLAR